MYEELIMSLRICEGACNKECVLYNSVQVDGDTCQNCLCAMAADAIEGLSRVAEAIPHRCECCVGCELEKKNGGCDHAFVLSPERAKAYIEENLDWWRKFRALMEAMETHIPEPPGEET